MNVYWLEQTEADVPAGIDWLSERELFTLSGFRIPKRRNDWCLGRWTAKCAVSAYLGLPGNSHELAKIEIRPATSGAPEVYVCNQRAKLEISLSHCSGTGLCAPAPANMKVGCDLERIEPRSEAFVEDYFTEDERAVLSQAPDAELPELTTLLWSAKESALKVLREGLRLDTRSVAVKLDPTASDSNAWRPVQVCYIGNGNFSGWWRSSNGLVRTVVANSEIDPPVALKMATHFSRERPCCA
jgi:4'-phosphopantetheinyl transferase